MTAIQNIYSMVERDAEKRVIPYCLEHNIGFVAFSPIASGLLSGKINSTTQFERNDDVRNWVPQLSKSNLQRNEPLIHALSEIALRLDCTLAQLSLAWMLKKYPNVVPIPGSKNKTRIVENLEASMVILNDREFDEIEDILRKYPIYGHRGF